MNILTGYDIFVRFSAKVKRNIHSQKDLFVYLRIIY